MFAAWSRDPRARDLRASRSSRLGQGVAGQVARDRRAAMVNETGRASRFVARGNPVSRLLCVPAHLLRARPAEPGPLRRAERDPQTGRAALHPGRPRVPHALRRPALHRGGELHGLRGGARAQRAARPRQHAAARDQRARSPASAILETAVSRIQEAFQYPVVAISVPDHEGGDVPHRRRGRRATRAARRDGQLPHARGRRRAAPTARSRPCTSPTSPRTPTTSPSCRRSRSEVAIPILSGDEVVAVLNVEKATRPAASTASQVITLETLADGIGIMLRNAELYQALERTNAKLVELDRMKSELVNIVAHDFRAPLAGVLGPRRAPGMAARRPARGPPGAGAVHHPRRHPHGEPRGQDAEDDRLETGQFPFDFGVVDLSAVGARGGGAHARARHAPAGGGDPGGPASPAGPTAIVWRRSSTTSSRTREIFARGRGRAPRDPPRRRAARW